MEGTRVQKPEGGGVGKLALGITAGLAGVLAAGYLGLCAYVGTGSTILPNVEIGGVDVGGMSQAQAQTALEEKIGAHMGGTTVQLNCGSWSGDYTGGRRSQRGAGHERGPGELSSPGLCVPAEFAGRKE